MSGIITILVFMGLIPSICMNPFQENCPVKCDCITRPGKTICRNQSLTSIPGRVSPGTKVLDVSYNSIYSVESRSFRNYDTSLKTVDLSHNRIKRIHNKAFLPLQNLHLLDLSNNLFDPMNFSLKLNSSVHTLAIDLKSGTPYKGQPIPLYAPGLKKIYLNTSKENMNITNVCTNSLCYICNAAKSQNDAESEYILLPCKSKLYINNFNSTISETQPIPNETGNIVTALTIHPSKEEENSTSFAFAFTTYESEIRERNTAFTTSNVIVAILCVCLLILIISLFLYLFPCFNQRLATWFVNMSMARENMFIPIDDDMENNMHGRFSRWFKQMTTFHSHDGSVESHPHQLEETTL